MKRIGIAAGIVALCAWAPAAVADLHLNEIYASHSGTDTQEFIELYGSGSLDNAAVLIVEGNGSAGMLDRAWDLTGYAMPGDGYFVLGDDGSTTPPPVPELDYSIGGSNRIENGTETFYLVQTATAGDMATLVGLLGTDVDSDDDGLIFTDPDDLQGLVTILDIIAMVDGGYPATDLVYDGTDVRGPDGTYFPAGIFRTSDYPNDWDAGFLDFDPGGPLYPQTPGTMNVPEPGTLSLLVVGALFAARRRR